MEMLYRIAIPLINGAQYYLTSDKNCPETDSTVDYKEMQFLSNPLPSDIHTFSSKELAQSTINDLPYPYNERAKYFEVESINSPPVHSIYYTIIRHFYHDRILWANTDKSFSFEITEDRAKFFSEEEANNFKDSLLGWDKRISRIVEIHDYGEPNYDFDAKILKTENIIKFRKNS